MRAGVVWMLAALAGCAGDVMVGPQGEELAADQVAPPLPQTMTLDISDPLVPGQNVQIRVSGAGANRTIYLARSNGQIGAGGCPPQLQGGCLGITPGGSGYQLVQLRSNAQGVAQMSVPLPPTLPLGLRLVFQAVDPAGPSGSNTLERMTASNCTEDGFEDNDTPATATNRPGLYPATGNSCPQDDDCFGAVLQNGQAGTFTMTYDYTNDGDVDLALYDIPGGTLLDASAGTTDVDEVTWYNGTGAPVPVAACANLYSDNGGAPGAAYRMALSITTPVACAADALEPNDDSGTARARTPGHTAALSACMADRWDWYKVDARAGQTVTFTALHSYAEGDIDVYAVPAAGPNDTAQLSGAALDADTATTDNATVEFVAPADGTYWFAVYLYSDRGNALQGGANYELDIAVQ